MSIWHHITNIFKRPELPVTSQQLRNRQIWYDALKSGKYEQTRNRLVFVGSDEDRAYCCLGLACEVVLGCDPVYNEDMQEWGYEVDAHDGIAAKQFVMDIWPEELFLDTFGFDPSGGRSVQNVFTEANDEGYVAFQFIADMIPLDRAATRPIAPDTSEGDDY